MPCLQTILSHFMTPEKTENEQLLAEECHKRKRLEVRAEAATSTLNLTSEKHAKTRESVRMEEQRVDQTQQQIHQYIFTHMRNTRLY